ncbi:MAG: hypothetical protein K0S29_397 [Gammaproteobacteria bacterium]|nr:hypothetical protein [Gammaproteobacteria bacterium]
MVYALRRQNRVQIYRVKTGHAILGLCLMLGLGLLALELAIAVGYIK